MSKMGDLHLDISERLYKGDSALKISKDLKVPLSWVHSVDEDVKEYDHLQALNEDSADYGTR